MEQYVLPGMRAYFLPEWMHESRQTMRRYLDAAEASIDASVTCMQEAERLLAGGPLFEQRSFDFARPSIVYVVGIRAERARPYDPVRDASIVNIVRKLTGGQDN